MGQSTEKTVTPTVISGEVLRYPITFREMKLQGAVRLKVKTDGESVSDVQVISQGYALLAKEAEKNVRTWRFEKHVPTTFETIVRFELLDEEDKTHRDNGVIHLCLPDDLKITMKRQIVLEDVENESSKQGQMTPVVISSEIPRYPALARIENLQGAVRLRVTTDGKQVSDVQVEAGAPLLAKAAIANIRTWKFQEHPPLIFETTFKYTLVVIPPCQPNNHKHDEMTLRLPTMVELTATYQGECDPAIQKSPAKH